MSWSDGSTENIYRRYSKFFDLQVSTCVSVSLVSDIILVGVCVVACFRLQVITFPPVKTSILKVKKETVYIIQHCPLGELELVAKLSLPHPYDTGNYIVREESENVPMKLIEDSDECDNRTDDHRNV